MGTPPPEPASALKMAVNTKVTSPVRISTAGIQYKMQYKNQ